MSDKIITVVATHQAKPGKEAELKQLFISHVEMTRKEEGCINYELHVSVENPGIFMFYENWTSRAHLEAHLEKALVHELLPRMNELCARFPDIEMWEKIA
jgi:quinol monooxygenase YgiN